MSNNVQIPTIQGSPTTTIETIDEGGGVSRQVIVLGSIGDASGETQLSAGQKTSANSIPIVIASDQSAVPVSGTFWQTTQPVSGTVTANAGTNMSTAALALESGGNLATVAGTVSGGKVKVDPSGVTSPVSAAFLPLPSNAAQETGGNLATVANAQGASGTGITEPTGGSGILGWLSGIYKAVTGTLTVSGTVGVAGTVPVSGTFWQTTQPVSLTSLPALAAGSANIGSVNQGTSPWVVSQPDVNSTGNTINAATLNAAATISLANGEAVAGVALSGLTTSGATLALEMAGADGVTFQGQNQVKNGNSITSNITADGNYFFNTGGRTKLRVRVSVVGTGTITVAFNLSSASSEISLITAIPPGENGIGNVGGQTVSVTVTPTVTASNSYGTNYVVGGLLTFSNAFTGTGSGLLQEVVVTIKDVETSGFTFFPFSGNPSHTTWTDAAVANINANDVSLVQEPVTLTANSQLGSHTVAYATGLAQAMAPGSTTLYGVLIANAALTNQFGSTSDVTVTVKVLQDC